MLDVLKEKKYNWTMVYHFARAGIQRRLNVVNVGKTPNKTTYHALCWETAMIPHLTPEKGTALFCTTWSYTV
tara:strand:+ start:522 stop:737 length:216 start_codon:yes stop_codon:yes gene_type:complete